MECDLDLIEASRKLVEAGSQTQVGPGQRPAVSISNPNAAGIATDIGQDTRIREFDEHAAEEFRAGRSGAVVGAIIALAAGLALLMVGLSMARGVGGVRPALSSLAPVFVREKGFLVFAESSFLSAVCLGLGAAGLLVCLGMAHWAYMAHQAIQDVKLGGRPTVVGISAFTTVGLLLASVLVPPLGIIAGIILKLNDNPDNRDLGSRMIYASLAAIGYFLVNYVWGLASHLQAAQPPAPAAGAVPEG